MENEFYKGAAKIYAVVNAAAEVFSRCHHYWSKSIRDGKVRNMLNFIRKNMRIKLGKNAMREYKYYRSDIGRMKYNKYRTNG